MVNKQGGKIDTIFLALANTADGAFIINEAQHIIFWNKAAQEILGYTSDEVLGRECYDVLQGRNEKGRMICQTDCRITARAFSGKTVTNYDTCARTKSGEIRWINISILAIPPSKRGGYPILVHLFRNATQKKQQEQFVRQVIGAADLMQKQFLPDTPSAMANKPLSKGLTSREYEVLTLLVNGLNTRDIAHSLSISLSTARNHIQNILHKLQVHSRLEAVAFALEHGLVGRN